MTTKGRTSQNTLRQKTLKNSIHCSGIGLHSGLSVDMVLHPAEAGSGIRFRRSDLRNADIPATWENAVETPLCTTLSGQDGIRIATVEHLMSALSGCGIDNALVELNGPEVPAMDGSAAPFVFLIECAGTSEQNAPRRALEIRKEVTVSDPHRSATVKPGSGLSIDFEIDFDSSLIHRQTWSIQMSQAAYKRDVSRARTFGFLHEVDKLREMGLALGGSLDNAIVINGEGILNDGGLRYENEFVRHKVLDLIGDLYLVGGPVIGAIEGTRAGHGLTLRLIRALFADKSAWAWRDMTHADLDLSMGPSTAPARAVAAPA